jgi:hypothetical protein
VDCSLPYFKQRLITHSLSALLPFQSLFTESSSGDQLLASPPFSSVLKAPHPLWCMFLFSSLFIIQFCFLIFFFFLQGEVSVCPAGYAGLSQGWLWEYCMMLICSSVSLPDVSQAGLEPASGSTGALLFSQCNVTLRSFVQAGGSGCQSFDSS